MNGTPVNFSMEKGYAIIEREWKANDKVEVEFPMDIQRVVSRPELKADEGRVALQRGPIVYCLESVDNNNNAWNILLPDQVNLVAVNSSIGSESIVALEGSAPVVSVTSDGMNIVVQNQKIRAIPYYTWSNRGSSEMQVWLPVRINDIKINR